MKEYLLFILRLPLLIMFVSIFGGILCQAPDIFLATLKLVGWTFSDDKDGLIKNIPVRILVKLGILILCATALFLHLKYSHFESYSWHGFLGVQNVHEVKG